MFLADQKQLMLKEVNKSIFGTTPVCSCNTAIHHQPSSVWGFLDFWWTKSKPSNSSNCFWNKWYCLWNHWSYELTSHNPHKPKSNLESVQTSLRVMNPKPRMVSIEMSLPQMQTEPSIFHVSCAEGGNVQGLLFVYLKTYISPEAYLLGSLCCEHHPLGMSCG